MDWRREDSGYAVAALVAVVALAYLLAANFGLVPSPIRGLAGSSPAEAAIEVAPAAVADLPAVPPATPTTAPPAPPLPLPPIDAAPPVVTFATPEGTAFGLTDPASVTGRVTDVGRGVDRVVVTFTSGTVTDRTTASLQCSDASRRNCVWSADVPAVVADYTVTARAQDLAGNKGTPKNIALTVVNPGGAVGVGDTVDDAPYTLEDVMDAARGLLGGGA